MLCCVVLCYVVFCCVVLLHVCFVVLHCLSSVSMVTYMTLGRGLVPVLPHDLLECDVEAEDLGHDVYAAHDDLVQVAISDEIWRLQHTVLKTCPHSVRVRVGLENSGLRELGGEKAVMRLERGRRKGE